MILALPPRTGENELEESLFFLSKSRTNVNTFSNVSRLICVVSDTRGSEFRVPKKEKTQEMLPDELICVLVSDINSIC